MFFVVGYEKKVDFFCCDVIFDLMRLFHDPKVSLVSNFHGLKAKIYDKIKGAQEPTLVWLPSERSLF